MSRNNVLSTDEKNFYLNPPVNRQNDCVWSAGKNRDIDEKSKIVWSLRDHKSIGLFVYLME